jgi:hypothetical protein
MFVFALCLFAFLATASLAQPAERDSSTVPRAAGQPLCGFVWSAASAIQLDEEESARPQEEEIPSEASPDHRFPVRSEELSPAELLRLRAADLQLFETSLVNWRHFEDLAPKQRTMIGGVLARCGATGTTSLAASVFGQFNVSQRATFVGTTHALLNTVIIDRQSGEELGNALQLVEELVDIWGENNALHSDKQFQLIVRLTPDAAQKLERAAHFEQGENHIFHKEYPISFRQFRRIGLRGQQAGLHISLTRDKRMAQIHIDYRFGLLHLLPTNSDLRADGNHQRHVDRWPQFRLVQKRVKVRRPVLQQHD